MSWIEKLFRTYEENKTRIGDQGEELPLEPICHTTQNAHVSVVIDGSGNFLRGSSLLKAEARTLVPATEESAGRSGIKPVCHPLCDKLQYVAGDLGDFGGDVTAGYANDPGEPHRDYLVQLEAWCGSPSRHPKVAAVLAYVKKGTVVSDLVSAGVLHVEEDKALPAGRRLLNQWLSEGSPPDIFKALPGGTDAKGKKKPWQADAFVRWIVETPGDPEAALWTIPGVWQSWVDYYSSSKATKGMCYVTGQQQLVASQHPAKIRNSADKARLISSNDESGYTFRGRFTTADEACGVSFEVTQKTHNALRWLIGRQGYRDGDLAVVAWAVSGADIPDPMADTFALALGRAPEAPAQTAGYTAQEIGVQFSKRVAGYTAELGDTTDVVVMALDSATPGRMAISFYRELTGSELLTRVQAWHAGCCWPQYFGKDRVFDGAPSPRDIAQAAYGSRLDGKLRKATVERLLPCIVDGTPIPRDLVLSCVRRASNRRGIGPWEWEKALGIACALYRYENKGRSYSMALERERNSRDYLYGRLLALAEGLEERALYLGGEKRETNAGKLMQRFAERPYATWLIIETSLTPYKVRLRAKRAAFLHNIETEMDEVASMFVPDDFTSDQRLSGEFLLGYHCQRAALREGPRVGVDDTDADTDE